eukprot:TRINITY_DN10533_c0_g2_i2.p1 TRINITY_DN10533_c0_g2~~TRINITY_DN10533_c0_g2_i2.p1  ORF type:complete len:126 (-),score=25.53 TRINITY_DN10533_c0_g2_i2:126-503(-)
MATCVKYVELGFQDLPELSNAMLSLSRMLGCMAKNMKEKMKNYATHIIGDYLYLMKHSPFPPNVRDYLKEGIYLLLHLVSSEHVKLKTFSSSLGETRRLIFQDLFKDYKESQKFGGERRKSDRTT